jgi:hypothetical protein
MPLENPVTHRPSAPVQDVFGGERQTPHAVFAKSRAESGWTPENPNGTVSVQHRPNDLAMGCPTCRAAGKPGVRMFAREGVGYYCVGEPQHRFKDFDELMAMNPEKLPYRGITARQEGFIQVQVEVPGSVAQAFQGKFGDRGAATLAAVMNTLSQSRAMILGEEDLKNIEEKLGKPVTNGAVIAGEMYSLKTSLEEASATITRLRTNLQTAARGSRVQVSDSTVIVDLGEELAQKVNEQASQREWSAEAYITEATRLAIEGGWV